MPIELDDICFNKIAIIERCLVRVFEEYKSDTTLESPTHADALLLNLERACQAAIDLAMHLVARDRLGMPQDSADAFVLLSRAQRIAPETAKRLSAMVGFRNVAVHEYQRLNMDIVKAIVEKDWSVFEVFAQQLGMRIDPKGAKRR